MEPIPYRVSEEDIDEVLDAYEPAEGGAWSVEERERVRAHVMRNVLDVDDIVRTVPEDERALTSTELRVASQRLDPDGRPERREAALAAIEDLLIRDGIVAMSDRETRVFPPIGRRDNEHDDA